MTFILTIEMRIFWQTDLNKMLLKFSYFFYKFHLRWLFENLKPRIVFIVFLLGISAIVLNLAAY